MQKADEGRKSEASEHSLFRQNLKLEIFDLKLPYHCLLLTAFCLLYFAYCPLPAFIRNVPSPTVNESTVPPAPARKFCERSVGGLFSSRGVSAG